MLAKRLNSFKTSRPAAFLLAACYAAFVLAGLLLGLGRFVYNRALYATGRLEPAMLSAADFEYTEMDLQPDGTLLCTGADPQMYLLDTRRRIDTLRADILYSQPPQIVNVFWAQEGQDYSSQKMAYPRDGDSLFWLPAGGVQALRLDPGIVAGNTVDVRFIAINEKRPFYAFFIPSASGGALLLFGPALLACALSLAPPFATFSKKEATT